MIRCLRPCAPNAPKVTDAAAERQPAVHQADDMFCYFKSSSELVGPREQFMAPDDGLDQDVGQVLSTLWLQVVDAGGRHQTTYYQYRVSVVVASAVFRVYVCMWPE